ncbi:hypothetical protein HZB07_01180 [Candidatus Saganbacteria bacterium]|nr:hypothetical protein [Candidatus Saganbacteria bacterium]
MKNTKSEILNSKQIRNYKFKTLKRLNHSNFGNYYLFRISILVFSILALSLASVQAMGSAPKPVEPKYKLEIFKIDVISAGSAETQIIKESKEMPSCPQH